MLCTDEIGHSFLNKIKLTETELNLYLVCFVFFNHFVMQRLVIINEKLLMKAYKN